jgi:hypothetical protein
MDPPRIPEGFGSTGIRLTFGDFGPQPAEAAASSQKRQKLDEISDLLKMERLARRVEFHAYMHVLILTLCRQIVAGTYHGTVWSMNVAYLTGELSDERKRARLEAYIQELGGLDALIAHEQRLVGRPWRHQDIPISYFEVLMQEYAPNPQTLAIIKCAKNHCPDLWVNLDDYHY